MFDENLNSSYGEFLNLIPNIFSIVSPASGSTFLNSNKVFMDDLDVFNQALADFKNNLNVLTSNVTGIAAWEDLIQIGERPDLSLDQRRARVFTRVAGTPETIDTLKNIVKHYTGTRPVMFEYGAMDRDDPYFDINKIWTYQLIIEQPPVIPYNVTDIIKDLSDADPAHCNPEIAENYILGADDIFILSDSFNSELANVFIVGVSLVGGPDLIG